MSSRPSAQLGPIVGPATGFALTLEGAARPGLWITGRHRPLRRSAPRRPGLEPDVAIVNIGAVKFPLTAIRFAYTMDAAAAVKLIELASPGIVVPAHVEGWSHFSEQEDAAAAVFAGAPAAVRDRIDGCRSASRSTWCDAAVRRAWRGAAGSVASRASRGAITRAQGGARRRR